MQAQFDAGEGYPHPFTKGCDVSALHLNLRFKLTPSNLHLIYYKFVNFITGKRHLEHSGQCGHASKESESLHSTTIDAVSHYQLKAIRRRKQIKDANYM